MKSPIFVGLLLLSLLAVGLGETAETEAPATPAVLETAPGVTTSYWFPKYGASLAFPAGDVVEVIAGFHNGFNTGLNITNITGTLRNTAQYGYDLPAEAQYHLRVPEGQDMSLSYSFPIDRNLPALKFQVALRVFYQSENTAFVTTFFNETITIVEKSVLIDSEQIFMWLIILGLALLPAWFGYRYLRTLPFFKKATKRTKKVETTQSASNADEWLAGTYYAQHGKPKVSKGKPSNVKNLKAKAG